MKNKEPIVCELGLTQPEVDSVRWVFWCWLQQYREHEYSEHRANIEGLARALEELNDL